MTYLESITYLTGRFVQISQYLLKTSFRLVSFMEEEKNRLPFQTKESIRDGAEAKAESLLNEYQGSSAQELIDFFSNKGISVKDRNELSLLLRKRQYLVGSYFLVNDSALGREEVAIYESKINELKELNKKARDLNGHFAKLIDEIERKN